MAFDVRREDYQRMSLRFARSLGSDQAGSVRAFATFSHRLSTDRDSLPQTDSDRAFHLVGEATALIDYELPFATDEAAETIVERAHNLLDEAIALDEHCYDAIRMRQSAEVTSFEGHYRFLCEYEDEVRAGCETARREAERDDSPERARLGYFLAVAPLLRWLAALSEKALICGRNREALRHARRALEQDDEDTADVRFTAAYAHAKLEDEQGLDRLIATTRNVRRRYATDAWTTLSRACLAHRRRAFAEAHDHIAALVAAYPNAAVMLARQDELPDGVFARIAVAPYSEDELVIAVSEATVLLQEGRDMLDMGVFGSWVMREALALATPEQSEMLGALTEQHDDGKSR